MPKHFSQIFLHRNRALLKAALREDIGSGDITSRLLVPQKARSEAFVVAKSAGVFAGGPVLFEVFRMADPSLKAKVLVPEGKKVRRGQKVFKVKGNTRSILAAERTALNLLGHLSGIATRTRQFVERVRRDHVLILDTRKTTPLWRDFEKYAVRVGGGKNHRMGLYESIFIKENHRRFGTFENLKRYRSRFEIEVRNMAELKEALALSPRVILFDNFRPDQLRRAVRLARATKPEIILEASGGITLANVSHYSALGVDWISVGALTHSVECLDFSLLVCAA